MRLTVPVALLAMGALLPSCARHVPDGLLTSRDRIVETCRPHEAPSLRLTYLGAGGFYLQRGDDALLTAPFYSNPGFFRVLFGLRLRPDPVRIDTQLDEQIPGVRSVDAILAGHSHYDHLMDIPYIAKIRIRQGPIYGNETMTHVLAPTDLDGRLRILNDLAGDDQSAGAWIRAGDRSRFMALSSAHAPHFLGIKLFSGLVAEPRERLPRSAYGWKEGRTFAFLIDFLGGPAPDADVADPSVDFRVHYQDAASSPPAGFPPADLIARKGVDVAIVTVGGFAQADDYPEAILRLLHPRHVILAHWEDFFRDPAKPPKVVRGTSLNKLIHRLEAVLPPGVSWTLARPGVTLEFPVCPGGGRPIDRSAEDGEDR